MKGRCLIKGGPFLVCAAKGQTQELSEHKEIEIACIPTIKKVRKEGVYLFQRGACLTL